MAHRVSGAVRIGRPQDVPRPLIAVLLGGHWCSQRIRREGYPPRTTRIRRASLHAPRFYALTRAGGSGGLRRRGRLCDRRPSLGLPRPWSPVASWPPEAAARDLRSCWWCFFGVGAPVWPPSLAGLPRPWSPSRRGRRRRPRAIVFICVRCRRQWRRHRAPWPQVRGSLRASALRVRGLVSPGSGDGPWPLACACARERAGGRCGVGGSLC